MHRIDKRRGRATHRKSPSHSSGTRALRARLAAVTSMLVLQGWAPPAAAGQTGNPGASLGAFLDRIGLSEAQRDSVAHGHFVVRLLPGGADCDVAVVGILEIGDVRGAVRARVLDVERLLSASGKTFHTLGDPATDADVSDALLDTSDYRELRGCRPGSCAFKLPGSAMETFNKRVDWSATDAKAQADRVMHGELLRLAADYRARGNRAIRAYDDVHVAHSGDVFDELVTQSPYVHEYAPELGRYLTTYPAGRPPGTREILYWSEDRPPHLRPILTLNHVIMYAPSGGTVFVVRKQIYASHYFEGALELLAVVEGEADTGSGTTHLLLLRRFRFDNLPGGPAGIRSRVRQRLMEMTRSEVEDAWAMIGASAGGR